MLRRTQISTPSATPFPYTTLFRPPRSEAQPVVQPAAAERADDAAHAERDQAERDPRFGQAGHLGHGRREVAEDAEHAGEADRADAQREPHRLAVEVAQLADRVLVRLVWIVRQ